MITREYSKDKTGVTQEDDVVVLRFDDNDWGVSGIYYTVTYPGLAAKEMNDQLTLLIYNADGSVYTTCQESTEDIITTSGDDFGEMGDDQMPWG